MLQNTRASHSSYEWVKMKQNPKSRCKKTGAAQYFFQVDAIVVQYWKQQYSCQSKYIMARKKK